MTIGVNEGFACSGCGAELGGRKKLGGICYCESCGMINILPGVEHTDESLHCLDNANKELFDSEFYKAFNSFRQTAQLDRKNSDVYFGMALASNRIKYVYDHRYHRLQPVCYDLTEREFALDTNITRALQNAEGDAERSEFEARVAEIDKSKEKFRSYVSRGQKYDVFISIAAAKGSVEEAWAGELYEGLKAAGLTPFCPEMDLVGDANDWEDLTLYALYSSKLFILICSDDRQLNTAGGKRDYVRFYQTLSGEERSRESILVAHGANKIEDIPVITSAAKTVDIYHSDSIKILNGFLKPLKNVKIKLKGEAVKSFAPSESVKCLFCGEPMPDHMAVNGGCHCMNCGKSVPMPRKGQRPEVIALLNEGARHLSLFEFDEAYKTYVKAGRLDPLEPLAFFGGALAKNKINFIFDSHSKKYVAMSLGPTKNSILAAPGVITALALANDEQKVIYKEIAKEIDNTLTKFRGFMKQGLDYNVFICVASRGIGNRSGEWARELRAKVREDKYSIYVSEREGDYKGLSDPLFMKLYAMRCADIFIVACENESSLLESSAIYDCTTYELMHKGEENHHDICVMSRNAGVGAIPGVDRNVKSFDYTGQDDMALLKELAEQEEARVGVKYCAICESKVKKEKKLCPRCLSFMFNNDKLAAVKSDDKPFFNKILKFKAKAVEWIADHARTALIALAAIVLALIVGLVASIAANADVKSISNSEYDVTVTSEKRTFDKDTTLQVGKTASGTTYQWIKKKISSELGNEVDAMVIYTIECGQKYDGTLTIKVPIDDALGFADRNDILVCQVFNNMYLEPLERDFSEGYVTFKTEVFGKFAIFEITDIPTAGGDNGAGESVELYEILQTVDALDREQYTPNSLAELDLAYSYAFEIFSTSSATVEEIDEAISELQDKLNSLVTVADVSMLQALIQRVEDEKLFRETHYTEDSIRNLRANYNNALEVIEDKNSTQSQVDSAYDWLLDSIEDMRKKRTPFGTVVTVLLTIALLIGFSVICNYYDFGKTLQVIVWIATIIIMILLLVNLPEWPFWKVILGEIVGVVALGIFVLSMFSSSD